MQIYAFPVLATKELKSLEGLTKYSAKRNEQFIYSQNFSKDIHIFPCLIIEKAIANVASNVNSNVIGVALQNLGRHSVPLTLVIFSKGNTLKEIFPYVQVDKMETMLFP